MKYLIKIIFFILLSVPAFSQTDCKILKNCRLKYADGNPGIVIFNNNKHIELFENGKYFIKSDLLWNNDCEYEATITEVTLPDFPFKAGEKMKVAINSTDNNYISGVAVVRGSSFPVKFEIIEKLN